MCSSYEDAIRKVNALVSPKETHGVMRERNSCYKAGVDKRQVLKYMEKYLHRVGISLSKLDELSVIHVAGTKGKGSTSAMCESILRHHGYLTGFLSGPHLVTERERIQLNGNLLSENAFATYFHRNYELLLKTQEFEGDMPSFLPFITLMAFNVFIQEKVDVAIVEVGIGGVVDDTNILRNVQVVGITSLSLDHTRILGSTLREIARVKAGIMKPGCEAYTVRQPKEAIDELTAYAVKVKCSLSVVPNYTSYIFPETLNPILPTDVAAYKINSSLAIQLSHAWMRITQTLTKQRFASSIDGHNTLTADTLVLRVPSQTVNGLRQFKWPGRYQVIREEFANFFLDGAHTKESMELCEQWFMDKSDRSQDKILLFCMTGDRNVKDLLRPLAKITFKQVFFVIPTPYKLGFSKRVDDELLAYEFHAQIWRNFFFDKNDVNVTILECVADAFNIIKKGHQQQSDKPSVLITGSLYLVGSALSILDPTLNSSYTFPTLRI